MIARVESGAEMDIQSRFDAVIAQYDLLQHPFYQAWAMGTLPVEALRDYSNDWASFIGLVPKGWRCCGEEAIANEEVEHRGLWEDFAQGLGVTTGPAKAEGAKALAQTVDAYFESPVAALGSLYAFEAQQPHTSASKLQGLKDHYSLPESAHVYFQVHETDFAEPALLMERIRSLSPTEQETALASCEATAKALWEGLTSLYEPYEA